MKHWPLLAMACVAAFTVTLHAQPLAMQDEHAPPAYDELLEEADWGHSQENDGADWQRSIRFDQPSFSGGRWHSTGTVQVLDCANELSVAADERKNAFVGFQFDRFERSQTEDALFNRWIYRDQVVVSEQFRCLNDVQMEVVWEWWPLNPSDAHE